MSVTDPGELRDRLAVELAAHLARTEADPGRVAEQAYALADAMVRERDRWETAHLDEVLAWEAGRQHLLLDEPEPPYEEIDEGEAPAPVPVGAQLAFAFDRRRGVASRHVVPDADEHLPDWLDDEVPLHWDVESKPLRAARDAAPASQRPGLARTQPTYAEVKKVAR